jgi:hypothetical protein
MKLKEKFTTMVLDKDIVDWEKVCETIADDYAIEFAEWCDDNYFRSGKGSSNWVASLGWYDDKKFTTSVLLEIFKKEKGL